MLTKSFAIIEQPYNFHTVTGSSPQLLNCRSIVLTYSPFSQTHIDSLSIRPTPIFSLCPPVCCLRASYSSTEWVRVGGTRRPAVPVTPSFL